jgi:ribosomal protein L4
MFNVKSIFAIAIISALSVTVAANELVLADQIIDTSELKAELGAELASNLAQLHQQLSEDTDAILIAKAGEEAGQR